MKIYIIISYYLFILILHSSSCKSTQESKVINIDVISDDQVKDSESDKVKYKKNTMGELPSYFYERHWIHHFEDDQGDLEIYKTAQEDSRPSRYRNQLIFNSDGTCQYRWLAPNDAHEMRKATWIYNSSKIYLLEDKVDIIDVYDVYSISDTLLVMQHENRPLDIIYGKWRLVGSGRQGRKDQGYVIDIRGHELIIIKEESVLEKLKMTHSPRRLHEPLALYFEESETRRYDWLGSGPYGLVNDTLVIELQDGIESRFVRNNKI